MNLAVLALALLFLVAFPAAVLVNLASGPVSRSRVRTFAKRHELLITPTNGEPVIRYLALTRRWRVGGVIAGCFVSVLSNVQSGLSLNFLTLFAGWFVGALIAEIRLAQGPVGARRVATLRPRSHRAYIGRFAWNWPFLTLCLSVVIGLQHLGSLWLWLSVVILIGVEIVKTRVVERPQRALPADGLAADEAIRSRSLHVLCGGGGTLILYCVLGQLESLPNLVVPAVVGIIAVPVSGWLIATARWPVRVPQVTAGAL